MVWYFAVFFEEKDLNFYKNMSTVKEKKSDNLEHGIAGASSGFITRFIAQPFDVIKIRFQLQVEPIANSQVSKYRSLLHGCFMIYKEEGILAFWKGHIPAQALSITYGVGQFYSYNVFLKAVNNVPILNEWKYSAKFIAGGGAGFVATIVSFPFDTIRTRLIAQSNNRLVYKGMFHSCSCILKHETPKVFYYGLLPTLLQIVPHTGLQFAFYGFFTDAYKKYQNQVDISFYNSLLSGSIAGLLAKTIVYPCDLSRKRMQIQGFKNGRKDFGIFFQCFGFVDCLKSTVKGEGIAGLFKGLVPSQLKATITTALYFTTYEQSLVAIRALKLYASEW